MGAVFSPMVKVEVSSGPLEHTRHYLLIGSYETYAASLAASGLEKPKWLSSLFDLVAGVCQYLDLLWITERSLS